MTVTKFEGTYKCKWPGPTGGVCGCEFKAIFGKYEVKDKKQNGTSAVKCPACGHNLKPVTDAITIKELKGKEAEQHG